MKPRVLIIDDDEEIRTQMKWVLAADYEVVLAGGRREALERCARQRPQVALLDLGLPPTPHDPVEGMATLSGLLTLDRTLKVIVISGQSQRHNAVRAIGAGAYDFLCKPVDVEALQLLLQRCVYVSALEREYRELASDERGDVFEGMLGASGAMQEVFKVVGKVARTAAPVLILGESGTGKEMIARAIHNRSGQSGRPFVAINCNAIPASLIESELFGYEKGAFTGASQPRVGLIESAAGGTLFLDEIGDLPALMQVKLLRFLQEKRIQRVGGRSELEVATRVLAATHVDLAAAIKEGSFREDLFFRLAVVVCRLPALRERGADVGVLAGDFLRRFAALNGRHGLAFDAQALRAINSHLWPGNVRELQNRVHRAVIMADGAQISAGDLELAPAALLDSDKAEAGGLRQARAEVERELVVRALVNHRDNVSAAARALGISRPSFYELMHKLGVSR
jgi:two-component system NtrC family response regulator